MIALQFYEISLWPLMVSAMFAVFMVMSAACVLDETERMRVRFGALAVCFVCFLLSVFFMVVMTRQFN